MLKTILSEVYLSQAVFELMKGAEAARDGHQKYFIRCAFSLTAYYLALR